ncbi:MAG: PolC-type DNA polymerase III [Oscillospiraceae bacterium]|nr:PolC-type DNA polymerase III [Oscillospiraceae bacterium]
MNKKASESLSVLLEGVHFEPEIADKQVISAVHNSEENLFILQIESDELLSAACLNKAAESVKSFLGINEARIYPKYPAELFTGEYITDIIGLMKFNPVVVNGFLDEFEVSDDGEVFEITLKSGGREILLAEKIDKEIEKLVKGFFGVVIKIEFGVPSNAETLQSHAEKPPEIPVFVSNKPVQKQQDKPKFGNGFSAGKGGRGSAAGRRSNPEALETPEEIILPYKNENFSSKATLIFGKNITEEPEDMLSLSGERENAVMWGNVFNFEVKSVRQGKSAIIFIGFSDYTSSQTIKIFTTPEKADGFKVIKEAGAILVCGDLKYDEFEKEPLITPKSIMLLETEQITDDEPQKRCELHLHTNMSDKDAITPVKDLIQQAFKWGHRAVAVTDHGNLQAYPEAMNTFEDIKKKNPDADFKLIYGVEAYFVNDGKTLAENCTDYPVNNELIVFDIETTGLSPTAERITEIGAVKLINLEIAAEFHTFINPEKPIPDHITQLTGITDDMVKDAPLEAEALKDFIAFCGGFSTSTGGNPPFIAHNASFDTGFLREAFKRNGLEYNYPAVDTVKLCRAAVPGAKSHSLDAMAKHFKLGEFNHHRALDDAKVLSKIFKRLAEDAQRNNKELQKLGDLNIAFGNVDFKREQSYHMIILVRNQTGLKNLYKLVSLSNLNYFYKKPRIPLSELEKHREGLIVGSACEMGELYQAVLDGKPEEQLTEIAEIYDYLEIQPLANNEFLVRNGRADSALRLQHFNRRICELGKKLNKPVAATCDVHFMNKKDSIFREILQVAQGYTDASNQAPLYFRTTREMLDEFAYLGEETAYETVIVNPNKIADMIEQVRPIPEGTFTPVVKGAEEETRKFAYERAAELYGYENKLPLIVEQRLEKELTAIVDNGFAGLYIIARKLVKRSEENGYLVGSRGSVGSSFAATMLGISEVNPLPPHYRCPVCKYSRFIEDGSVGSGFDLPPENCPHCGKPMASDGHDIPFETFMGFKGDKAPDIDLNFSGEYQIHAHKHTEEMFGKEYVFKAGTISAIQEKTAFGYVKKYLEKLELNVNKAELNRLAKGCTGVKVTTGQHPGGMVVAGGLMTCVKEDTPKEYEVYDFTPVQHPADDAAKDIITTHFDFHALHDTILKLDELGHDVPTLYRYLEDMTDIKIADVPNSDKAVMSLFTSTNELKLDEDCDKALIPLGTYGLPEFGTNFVIGMLKDAVPTRFSDLLQISGLSHGTDVWLGNAQELIKSGQCDISTVIGTRDNIMVYLMHKGMDPSMAFKITEITRKGGAQKLFNDEIYKAFEDCNVEPWYIESCKKIKYMFPKAHAAAYVTGAVKLGWFKVYHPEAFYAAVLTKHTENLDVDCVLAGKDAVKRRIHAISHNPEATAKDKAVQEALYLAYEMLCRGIVFLPVRYDRSDAARFLIEKGESGDSGLRLPFLAIEGCGENAANRLREVIKSGDFISVDEIKIKSGLNNSVMERLGAMNVFGGLPQSAQLSLFDF